VSEAPGAEEFVGLLRAERPDEIAARAVRIEQRSRYSMIFSFEKMALRDAVRSARGAQMFAEGLFAFLHGKGELQARFEAWVDVVAGLPRKQTRVRIRCARRRVPMASSSNTSRATSIDARISARARCFEARTWGPVGFLRGH
jgi:hypothetical protein